MAGEGGLTPPETGKALFTLSTELLNFDSAVAR